MVPQKSNKLDRLGVPIPNWVRPPSPDKTMWAKKMQGHYVRLESLKPALHCDDLFTAFAADTNNQIWDYLPYGPFETAADLTDWMRATCAGPDPYFFAIIDKASNRAVGVASYLRINPDSGSIEVGHINFSPRLQSTIGATEAMYLMMRWAFMAGYRRYEWKCKDLNTRSKQAARRLGFSFEGVFRQAAVVKGRNRDTAWFSVLDSEWPAVKSGFELWLDPANFNEAGGQRQGLMQLRDSGTAG